MNLIGRMLGTKVGEFAKQLSMDLGKRYPASMDNNPQKKISPNRLTKVLEDTFTRAIQYQREQKLGFFGRARLGNNFRWELKEMGYSEQFIEVATEGLIVYLTREAKKKPQEPAKSSG